MNERVRIALVTSLTLVAVALTLGLTFSTPAASAAAATRYAAGNLTTGTSICNCPVTVGNCVCAYTDPPAPDPVPADPILVAE
jgi:hypothetical protein